MTQSHTLPCPPVPVLIPPILALGWIPCSSSATQYTYFYLVPIVSRVLAVVGQSRHYCVARLHTVIHHRCQPRPSRRGNGSRSWLPCTSQPTPPPTCGPASSTPDLTSTTRPATRTRSSRIAPRPRGRPVIKAGQPLSSVLCPVPYTLPPALVSSHPPALLLTSPPLLLRLFPFLPRDIHHLPDTGERDLPVTCPALAWSGIWPYPT